MSWIHRSLWKGVESDAWSKEMELVMHNARVLSGREEGKGQQSVTIIGSCAMFLEIGWSDEDFEMLIGGTRRVLVAVNGHWGIGHV
eukprot:scaffold34572_cov54-Attheya_sp.AAC.3